MPFHLEDYLADADRQAALPRQKRPRPAAPHRPPPKASYESNAEVQEWLKHHDLGDEGQKLPFAPDFLAKRRDGPWLRSSLSHFYEADLIVDIVREIKSGKEASVFCCQADPRLPLPWVAAKIYRPRIFRGLKNDAVYRQHREQRDESGRVLSARRRDRAASHTERDRAHQISDWIQFEFATQSLLYDAGVATPQPLALAGNAILMDYLGDATDPAPRLSDLVLPPDAAQECLAHILADIARCLANHRIHGDLSPYNVLYWRGRPWIIDFAQAIDARFHDEAVFALLQRDVERICTYFTPYGIAPDPEQTAVTLWRAYVFDDEQRE